MHYYQFNIGDYIKSTNHLSIEEDITYRRLIDLYYDTEQPIPNDNPRVLRRIRLGSEYLESLEIILNEFFCLTGKGWENKRCNEDIESYQEYIAKQKANGSKGGRPKKPTAKPAGKPKQTQKKPNQEPLTTNHKPNIVIPDGINQPAWNEWIEFRKSKKKPVSQKAADKQFKLLTNHAFEVQQQIIDQSIQNDYQGLFEPKGNNNDQPNRSNQTSAGHRKTLPERVKENINRQRAERGISGLDGEGVAEAPSDVRLQVHQPVRGDAGQYMGELLEGDYSKADS